MCLPAVFKAPIRPDIVSFIHHEVAKNHRQPYCVNRDAGTNFFYKIFQIVKQKLFYSHIFYRRVCDLNYYKFQATKLVLNHGVLVVLSHVFHVFVVVVPTDPVRVLLVTCAVEVTCLLPLRCTEGGTGE